MDDPPDIFQPRDAEDILSPFKVNVRKDRRVPRPEFVISSQVIDFRAPGDRTFQGRNVTDISVDFLNVESIKRSLRSSRFDENADVSAFAEEGPHEI